MARTPKYYHHGRSPAAWTGSVIGAVGSIILAIGAVLGPNWVLVGIGLAIAVIAVLTAMVMKASGLGQP